VTWPVFLSREDTERPDVNVTRANHTRITVLVADNDRWARLSVSTVLSEAGFAVEQASNGVTALRIAAACLPHLVLVRSGLPEIATAEVVRSLRSNPRTRNAAVVEFRAGDGSAGLDKAAGGDLDVDGRFDFPCNSIELLATVVNALEARHSDVARSRSRQVSLASPKVGRVSAARQPVARSRE
jgi:sigma-B regulation protein RsbU (phosphoserine phosphatase)